MKIQSKRLISAMLVMIVTFGMFIVIPLTASAARPAPSNLTFNILSGGVRLDWQDNSSDEGGFAIYRKESNATWSFAALAVVPANSTFYLDTSRIIGKIYTYRICTTAPNGSADSTFSNETTAYTFPPPHHMNATLLNNSGITLSWRYAPIIDIDYFAIYRKKSNESWSFEALDTVPAGIKPLNQDYPTFYYLDTTAQPGIKYNYRVSAYRKEGQNSPQSSEATCIMGYKLLAPSDLTATAGTKDITLTWRDNSDNERNFILERRNGNDDFAPFEIVPANTTTFKDNTVGSGMSYTYRVRAAIENINSVYSNESKAVMIMFTAPKILEISANRTGNILKWQDNTIDENFFTIYRADEGSGIFTAIATVGENIIIFQDTTAVMGKTYSYRLTADKLNGFPSRESNIATIVTGEETAPFIHGDTTKTLRVGYSPTSTNEYIIGGIPNCQVAVAQGPSKVKWNNGTRKIEIDEGLPIGTYTVFLRLTNGVGTDKIFVFTFSVVNRIQYINELL